MADLDLKAVMEVIGGFLPEGGAALVAECKSVYGLEAVKADGSKVYFTLDLSTGNGSVAAGSTTKPHAVFMATEKDLVEYLTGKTSFDVLMHSKRINIRGNYGRGMKLRVGMLPRFTAENLSKYRRPRL